MNAFVRTDNCLKCRPLGLEFFLLFNFFAFGDFLELLVNVRTFLLVQLQFCQAAFIVNLDCRAILYSLLDVVDTDVISEHSAGVLVAQFNGSPCKSNERRVGQGVAHVTGVAVNEIILTAMGLIRNDNDVVPIGEDPTPGPSPAGGGEPLTPALSRGEREKFLNGGEDHPARGAASARPRSESSIGSPATGRRS